MIIKAIVIFIFLNILISLALAGKHLIKDDPHDSVGVVKSLTVRISLSIALFLLLMIAGALGWITPHGL
jgi:mannitol-specific phosphotransferase system IIBC component